MDNWHHHFHFSIKNIFDYLRVYGYGFVFIGTIFEGEIVLLAAGFLSYIGVMNFWLVLVVGIIGAALGDTIWYQIGLRAGPRAIKRFGKALFLNPKRIAKAQKYFEKHGNKTILLSRFVIGTRISTAVLAGSFGMPRGKFSQYNLLGAIFWAFVITGLGFIFANSFELLRGYLHRSEIALLIIGMTFIIILLLRILLERLEIT